jgi:hypothetical protein
MIGDHQRLAAGLDLAEELKGMGLELGFGHALGLKRSGGSGEGSVLHRQATRMNRL